jgi:uncharacterized protein (DUF849 family)
VIVQACLNGGRTREDHPAVPIRPAELATDAARCVWQGARSLHVHPRDAHGRETLAAEHVGAVVAAVRRRCPGIELSITTGLWIAGGDPEARAHAVAGWTERPQLASVNVGEEGWEALAWDLLRMGIGIEVGVASTDEAQAYLDSPLHGRAARVLVEVPERDGAIAAATARQIDTLLAGPFPPHVPRLWHGEEEATWAVLVAAAAPALRRDVRIGLEDVLTGPREHPEVAGNADLVAAVVDGLVHDWPA